MKIVGLAGLAGVGKDTVADLILEDFHGRRLAFADPLKDAIAEIPLGAATPAQRLRDLENRDLKEAPISDMLRGVTRRKMMVELGQGMRRLHPAFWVEVMASRVDALENTWKWAEGMGNTPVDDRVLVITDVRFANEAGWIRSKGGFVVKLDRVFECLTDTTVATERGLPDDVIDCVFHTEGEWDVSDCLPLVEYLTTHDEEKKKEDA